MFLACSLVFGLWSLIFLYGMFLKRTCIRDVIISIASISKKLVNFGGFCSVKRDVWDR